VLKPGFLGREVASATLGDPRRTRRLSGIIERLARAPDKSFPQAMGDDDAALEGFYRFVGSVDVEHTDVLAPHATQTAKRCAASRGRVVVAHDTTEFNFGRFHRKGLGHVGRGKSFGWYGHFSLAVEVDAKGSRTPLGVLSYEAISRDGVRKPHLKHGRNQGNPANEALRWRRGVDDVREELGATRVVHVMDREADDYALMAHMTQRDDRFVIRQYRRRAMGDGHDVRDALDGTDFVVEREVPLSPRRPSDKPSYRRRFPERRSRMAKLSFRAMPVRLGRPTTASDCPSSELSLTLVQVVERDVPEGEEPVEWWLWTNEPAQTPEQILAVVDAYRARWVIEEFFKALKTGCRVEERQLESEHALQNSIAIFIPIAWQLLLLRTLRSEEPAEQVLTKTQIDVLRKRSKVRGKRPFAALPTVRDAVLAIAALGGHLKHNGEPGWQVLARGFEELLALEAGYLLAIATEDVINH